MDKDLLWMFLHWTGTLAWPALVLTLTLIFRKQLGQLLSHVGGIAERASREPVELSLGDKFKMIFRQKLEAAKPQTVDEAKEVATELAGESLSIYETLRRVPLNRNQRRLLKKLVSPLGTPKAMTVEEAWRQFSKEDVTYLKQNGLIVEREAGLLEPAHSLIAVYVAAEVEE